MTTRKVSIALNWKSVVRIYIAVIEDGSPEGKEMAKTEIMEMAALLDKLVAERSKGFTDHD